jgi:iron complex transport system permease protein
MARQYGKARYRKVLVIAGLLVMLVALVGIGVTIGSAGLPVTEVYAVIAGHLVPGLFTVDPFSDTIVFGLRLHRVLFGVAAGFALAVCGAVMQGTLRNPLASPFTLGIASAASFGASLAIIFGIGFANSRDLVVVNAFIFTLLASFGIYALAKARGMTAETMVLAGIMLMYLFSAMTSFLQFFGTAEQNQEIVFWAFGSLNRTTWESLAILLVILAVTLPYILLKSWDINAITEGDEVATSLGVRVDRVRTVLMLAVSLITAAVISFTGTIGFIGLVAPHITRMAIGGDYRFLIPAAGLTGAVLLSGSDAISRVIIPGEVIPVGIITAFIGIPFFTYLFIRRMQEFW